MQILIEYRPPELKERLESDANSLMGGWQAKYVAVIDKETNAGSVVIFPTQSMEMGSFSHSKVLGSIPKPWNDVDAGWVRNIRGIITLKDSSDSIQQEYGIRTPSPLRGELQTAVQGTIFSGNS